MAKYLTTNYTTGNAKEAATVQTTAGAADADKIPSLNGSGVLAPALLNAKSTSAGAGDAGKIPQLDGTGRLDASFLPVGIGADTNTATASEALSAGDFVNVYYSAGWFCRKADAATNKPAHGFVLAAVANGATATIYAEGTNTQLSGLTSADQFLSVTTPGRTQATSPSASGQIIQHLGVAFSATAMNFQQSRPIEIL